MNESAAQLQQAIQDDPNAAYTISQTQLPGESERKFLLRSIEARVVRGDASCHDTWQRRPYTAVKIEVCFEGRSYIGLGFAKCHWPDPWDEEYGEDLARRKAVAEVVRKITYLEADDEVSQV